MAVELAWSTYTNTGSDDWTVEMGGGLASGQLLVLMCYSSSGTIPATPSGWTLESSEYTYTTAHRCTIFKRIADGTEGTVTLTNTVDSWILTAWTGYDVSGGIPLSWESPAAQSLATHVCPAVTMPSTGQVIRGLGVYSGSGLANWTRPSGTTLIADSYGAGSIRQTRAARELKTSGDAGTGVWTSTSPVQGTAFTVGIPGLTSPTAPTVDALATSDATPTVTGTFTAADTDSLSVTIAGVEYSGDDVLIDEEHETWSVTVSSPLAVGTYDVTVVATNAGGDTGDATTDELVVLAGGVDPACGFHVRFCPL